MVLGLILYETADLAVNIIKLSYNGVTGVYNWWYQVDKIEKEEQHKEREEMIHQLKKLNNRVQELEETLKNK
tara:strand:+ start:1088 stop:1303 length:216 start_codon:yes stop_codon:yes gene_type:complete